MELHSEYQPTIFPPKQILPENIQAAKHRDHYQKKVGRIGDSLFMIPGHIAAAVYYMIVGVFFN